MARHYKKWEEHSPRWQRESKKKGLTPQRWNGWLKLSEKTRKDTDPRKYASGVGVASQRREKKEYEAAKKIRSAAPNGARSSVVQRNVKKMSDKDLEWTLKASPNQIRNKAKLKIVEGYSSNPWWYR